VIPFVALVTVFGTLAFAPRSNAETCCSCRGDQDRGLAYFVLEAIPEWTAALTPSSAAPSSTAAASTAPNVFIGLLIGSCLWVAHRLRTEPASRSWSP
jgi:hypothetical protein